MILQNSAENLYHKQILQHGYQKIDNDLENQKIFILSPQTTLGSGKVLPHGNDRVTDRLLSTIRD